MKDDDFGAHCRLRFEHYTTAWHLAAYHSLKRKYAEKAWQQVDAYLDWLDIQKLETVPDDLAD